MKTLCEFESEFGNDLRAKYRRGLLLVNLATLAIDSQSILLELDEIVREGLTDQVLDEGVQQRSLIDSSIKPPIIWRPEDRELNDRFDAIGIRIAHYMSTFTGLFPGEVEDAYLMHYQETGDGFGLHHDDSRDFGIRIGVSIDKSAEFSAVNYVEPAPIAGVTEVPIRLLRGDCVIQDAAKALDHAVQTLEPARNFAVWEIVPNS